ncbi:MAG: hypothetical protein PHV34_23195 [Verrucomicrobiae bacterium]|nr:hypothetical protein [Verrucomicrobiae bacterium]
MINEQNKSHRMPQGGKTQIWGASSPSASNLMSALSNLKKSAVDASKKNPLDSAENILVQITHGSVKKNGPEPIVAESPVPLSHFIEELFVHVGQDVAKVEAVVIPLLTNGKIKFESDGRFKRLQAIPHRLLDSEKARKILSNYLAKRR